METVDVAVGLVGLCSEGRFLEAIDKYYSDHVESVEGHSYPGIEKRLRGVEAVRQKNRAWVESSELHSCEVRGPFVSEESNQFGVYFVMDATDARTGQRFKGAELALYTVKNGKIVREEFFYLQR